MAKTRDKKKIELDNLQSKFEKSKSVVFSSQSGIPVSDIEKLRGDLKSRGSEMQSTKKTLLSIMLKNNKVDFEIPQVNGTIGIVYSYDDEVAAANAIYEFKKTHEGMEILGGMLEKEVIDSAKVIELASLPSKDALRAMVVRTIQAPVSGFVNVLAGTTRSLVQVLQSIGNSKQ